MSKSRPALWKRILRFCLFSVIAIVTLVALALSWISFQGRREWTQTKADLRARGEKLSLVEFTPPAIPNDQNFFGDPMWRELTDTVDAVSQYGLPFKEPKIPRGKRLIDAMDPAMTPELVERTGILFRDGKSRYSTTTSCWLAANDIINKLKRSTDPASRRELARLALDILAPGLPTRRHIEILLSRPEASFTTGYSEALPNSFPTLNYILRAAQISNISALAHLTLGDSPAAARDTLVTLRLAQTLQAEPLQICRLTRFSILGLAEYTINRGIADHQWTDADLITFEKILADVHLPQELVETLRAERGFSNQVNEALMQNSEAGKAHLQQTLQVMEVTDPTWKNASPHAKAFATMCWKAAFTCWKVFAAGDQAYHNRFVQRYIDTLVKPGHLEPNKLPDINDQGAFFRLAHFVAVSLHPSIRTSVMTMAYRQDEILQTRIACALERYRLKYGAYPDSLEAIAPEFLPGVPDDIIAGQKFHYRRESPDKFRLWSSGWNRIDENGLVNISNTFGQSDWVWNQPAGFRP